MTSDPTNDAVRALLHALGDEPAPADVIDRLERVLAAQLPAVPPGAGRRSPRRARRIAIGLAGPLVVAGVVAFAVVPRNDRTGVPALNGAVNAEAAKGSAAAGAAPGPTAPAGGASSMFDTVTTHPDPTAAAANGLAAAARAAYAAVEAALQHATP